MSPLEIAAAIWVGALIGATPGVLVILAIMGVVELTNRARIKRWNEREGRASGGLTRRIRERAYVVLLNLAARVAPTDVRAVHNEVLDHGIKSWHHAQAKRAAPLEGSW